VGGTRTESLKVVLGRSTLPALASAGMPSTPVIDKVERQVRFKTRSTLSLPIGLSPSTSGNFAHTSLPSARAVLRACAARSRGIATLSSLSLTAPVASSSRPG
jgi:hypothetical protein